MYASWAETAERAILHHHGVQSAAASTSVSRTSGPKFTVKPLRQAQHTREVPLRDQKAQWWTRVHAVLQGMHRHRARGNGPKQIVQYTVACSCLVGCRPEGVHALLRDGRDPPWQQVLHVLNQPRQLALPLLESFVGNAKRVKDRAQRAAVRNSFEEFKSWVVEPSALGALHRSLKPQPLPPKEVLDSSSNAVFHPRDIMGCKRRAHQK
eukprot:3921465-Pyramimonas_sp.AAC.1